MKTKVLLSVYMQGWNQRRLVVANGEWNRKIAIDAKDAATLKKIANSVLTTMPTITSKTKVYLDKASDVSRAKFKEFLEANGCKRVTKLDKADVVFISKPFIDSVKAIKPTTEMIVPASEVTKIEPTLSGVLGTIRVDKHETDPAYLALLKTATEESIFTISGYRNTAMIDNYNRLFALGKAKVTLVSDDILLSEVNKDGLDLDEDIRETLEGMLLSKDNETFQLGIEMLSNVNLSEGNVFRIALMLNKTHTLTSRLNALSYITNKNFKSLLVHLNNEKIAWNHRWESFGMSMLAKYKGTEYEDEVKQFLVDGINRHFNRTAMGENVEEIVGILI